MERVVKEITLNVASKNTFHVLTAKQFDNASRVLKVTITNNGTPITIHPTDTVIANFRRPKYSTDKTSADYIRAVNCEVVNGNDGIIYIPLDYWAVGRAGVVIADVSILVAGAMPERLTTASFDITVFPATCYDEESLRSESYDALLEIFRNVDGYKRQITVMALDAIDSSIANEEQRTSEYEELKSRMSEVVNDAEQSAAQAVQSAEIARINAETATSARNEVSTALGDFTTFLAAEKTAILQSETNAGSHAASASESRVATDTAISQFTTFLAEESAAIESAERLAQTHESNAASEANRAAQYADSARGKAELANTALAETNATVGEFSAHMARVKESIETSERNAEAYKDASASSASAAQRSEESAQTQAAFVSDTADEINSTVATFRAWVSEQESTISADRQGADQSKSDAEASATTAAQFADSARESAESANTALTEANATMGEFSAHLETEKANIAQSVATASSQATVATDNAAEAAQSATNAELSANAASASAADAESSASRASQEAIAAESSATSAATEKSELETVIADFRQWFTEEKHNMGGSIVTIIEAQNIDIGELFAQYGTGLFLWEYDGVKGFVGCDKYAPLSVHAKSCYLFVFEMNEQQVGWYLFDNYEQTLFNDVSIPEGFTYGFYNLSDGTGNFITDIGVTLYNITSDLQGLMEDKRYLVRFDDLNAVADEKLSNAGIVNGDTFVDFHKTVTFKTTVNVDYYPTESQHAANKQYVDDRIGDIAALLDTINGEVI